MQQLSLFENVHTPTAKIELAELFEAYRKCRQNKRNTLNALAIEVDYEANLIRLGDQINSARYRPGKSIAFIINKPVKREVFAAEFRDRVAHHLIINKLNPLLEKIFIYDSYACRSGKGIHFGIQRADRFIRRCSQNYTRDCYVLKLDIQGFFMHINKAILFEQIRALIEQSYQRNEKLLLLELCGVIIYNNPTTNCIVKSKHSEWQGLPADKSLYHSPEGCGLPIVNLTSQIFANLYMKWF